jgi:hypothetical protein
MGNEKVDSTHSNHQEWEFVKEVSGYKLCVNSENKNIWKYKLLNIAAVVSESNGFSSKQDAIKNASEKAKKLKKEKDKHFMEIKSFFKK